MNLVYKIFRIDKYVMIDSKFVVVRDWERNGEWLFNGCGFLVLDVKIVLEFDTVDGCGILCIIWYIIVLYVL